MSVESEFEEHWNTFHKNMQKAQTLLRLYPGRRERKAFASHEGAVPVLNDCFIKLLKVKDERLLRIFDKWKSTNETGELAEEIERKRIGGHLAADVTYTFWKYADVVRIFRMYQRDMKQKVLLEQAVMASCTAYECFLKRMIPWILSNHEESAKRYLGTIGLPMKELGKFDFDPMGNVDRVFLHEYRNRLFPVFPEVVKFYKDIFGIDLFWSKREAKYVDKIFAVRHCIVHSAGKPDQRWKKRTRGAKYVVDLRHAGRYVLKVHTKLHDTGVLVYDLLGLDLKKAPFHADEIGDWPPRWKFVEVTS